jgi:hypothetical protein
LSAGATLAGKSAARPRNLRNLRNLRNVRNLRTLRKGHPI